MSRNDVGYGGAESHDDVKNCRTLSRNDVGYGGAESHDDVGMVVLCLVMMWDMVVLCLMIMWEWWYFVS